MVMNYNEITKPTLAIIGNGMVGHRFIEQCIDLSLHQKYTIITFCEEPRLAYDRVHLSTFFSGTSAEELCLVPNHYYDEFGIRVYTNDKVTAIHPNQQSITSANGLNIHYDKLVIATGSYPFVPPIPGHDRPNCFVYRTIEDLESIQAGALDKDVKIGTVVGGGLLGLEAAKAVKDLGLETHVVEFAPKLMATQLDSTSGDLLQQKIESLDVHVHTNKNTQEITAGSEHQHKMNFSDGEYLETDLILFSAGIRPRDEIARAAGLDIGSRGGIVIDDHCQTSESNIYAIGECALWNNRIFGLVAPGYEMARIAALHISGDRSAFFSGADLSTKLKLLGVDVASIGDAHGRTEGSKSFALIDEANGIYKKIVVSQDKKTLLGGILIGDVSTYGTLLQLAINQIPLPKNPDDLILPQREGSSMLTGPDALPNNAIICSCNNVSKEAICNAIGDGATDLASLKTCTKASTTCGGCTELVKEILNSELEKQGIAVAKGICEHFSYSRQELYHIVRVEGIRSFEQMIAHAGRGHGCDICKPTIASILASCWNDYILKEQHAALQDTNDYYLANMQKNGSYSVVPRIPGGEITPDKLITIGKVASKYQLYTKITGGQRIDLFGARLEQLPDIWRELIDAGFESGHAYGKAMRTVKSCVGSTWCRYGVQDSVSMAIAIEHRYRGLRAPHKIKLAVSGCTRECAEAQSKDVGVIATEKGWNLYVGGNGGMRPRHADLLAVDLDNDTLIKFIDRFLMFYIKTGDRLQRTATWMNNLEGGLEYLKAVICEDSLGIAEELESQMAHIIGSYQCEWKTTINDPEKVKRFRHFINSDKSDENIQFIKERDQIRPARKEERVELVNIVGN